MIEAAIDRDNDSHLAGEGVGHERGPEKGRRLEGGKERRGEGGKKVRWRCMASYNKGRRPSPCPLLEDRARVPEGQLDGS